MNPIRRFNGMTPVIADSAWVDPTAVVIGDVVLAEDVSVWPCTVIRGDMNHIRIGRGTNVQDGSVLHITHKGPETRPDGYPLIIGEEVTIGHKVLLHGCTIGHQVLVGMGSIVMDGAVLEDGLILGAGSLVTPGKQLASGFLYAGSPARQIRPLNPRERAYLSYSAGVYRSLKDQFKAEASSA